MPRYLVDIEKRIRATVTIDVCAQNKSDGVMKAMRQAKEDRNLSLHRWQSTDSVELLNVEEVKEDGK